MRRTDWVGVLIGRTHCHFYTQDVPVEFRQAELLYQPRRLISFSGRDELVSEAEYSLNTSDQSSAEEIFLLDD
jgi:hypothetical protein